MKTFNWGIIGLGKIAHNFAKDLQVLPNAHLHAVASRSEERSQLFAQQYDVPYSFGVYEDIFNAPNLDAIYIATPHTGHYENTLMCLTHHIPVLCEKPLAMNHLQAKEMIAASKAHQTFLMEALWSRFLPPIQKTLEIITGGGLGEIISIRADFGFKAPFLPEKRLFNRDLGGGALLDIGLYPVFLALLLMGKPDHIKAFANLGNTKVDEECGILLQYNSGKMAHLHATLRATTPCEAFIYGERGNIHIRSRWHEAQSLIYEPEGGEAKIFRFDYKAKGYYLEAIEVMNCVTAGKLESDQMPLSFSLQLMELLDAIREEAGIAYPLYD